MMSTDRNDDPTERRLRIAIMGAGKMARHHARAILRLGDAIELVGYADPLPSARAAMQEVAPTAYATGDAKELLSTDVADVVHICTPPQHHTADALRALEAGLHIYVEKPFAPTSEEAQRVLATAERVGAKVSAGHQLLFEKPTFDALRLIPAAGKPIHVESYFSFRPVRRAPGGGAALPPHLQLFDILPHPVYLLLRFLDAASSGRPAHLTGLSMGPGGTVHGLVEAGGVTGSLVVTLEGRPIENFVRFVGTNGTVTAEYVRGTVMRSLGPGVSGIDKVLEPYREARQLSTATTGALWRRFAGRERSYPGLREAFEAFYNAIRRDGPPPVAPSNILGTTQLCEQISREVLSRSTDAPLAVDTRSAPRVVVTGGTGFLGRALVDTLRQDRPVTVLSRRLPSPWERLPGVEYLEVDLAEGVSPESLEGAEAIVHCAAATSGGWEAHQRDSIGATRQILEAAAKANVDRVIHISSIAVQSSPSAAEAISENTPLLENPRNRGPYAWGKLESERVACELAEELELKIKVVRPGALVDYSAFDPPGRLGRRVAKLFVAVGSRLDRMGVADVQFAADTIGWLVDHWAETPDIVNLLDPELPTKKELVARLKEAEPDLSVIWLPRFILKPLSLFGVLLQKMRSPGKPAINVARVFAPEEYDTSRMRHLITQRLGD